MLRPRTGYDAGSLGPGKAPVRASRQPRRTRAPSPAVETARRRRPAAHAVSLSLIQPAKMAAHPVGQKEIRSVILGRAATAAVGPVGTAVPLAHRPFVRGEHRGQLIAFETVLLVEEFHVNAMRVLDVPLDHVHR